MSEQTFEMDYAGKKLTVKIGDLAQQTNGSCLVQYGDTVVLATAVISLEPREGTDFFPLMVEYEEKMYAAGKIKGSRFIKRETKPTDEAILTARMIDRGLRPLFDESIRRDVQVVVTVLSIDNENEPDILAIIAASIAVHISDIPWAGPIAGIRIGRINNEWAVNPPKQAKGGSIMDIAFSTTKDKVIMVEADAQEAPEDLVYEAFKLGLEKTKSLIQFINDIREKVGKKKIAIPQNEAEEEELDKNQKVSLEELKKLQAECRAFILEKLDKYLFNIPRGSKNERKAILHELKDSLENYLKEKQVGKERRQILLEFFDALIEEEVTRAIMEREQRIDGRKLTDLRPLSCRVGLLPRTHGSAVFNRGETQVLSVVTLGSPGEEQVLDNMDLAGKKHYMHHYNFPPFSTGEAYPMRGTGRREVGHGALAEKALIPVLPPKEEFPYTIRVVSEVLSSNGSSSMASACGSTLALMDAGVPIKKPVAGIAMGLAKNNKGEFKILTDIQDLEDGPGGMDFKIAGTRDGITAIQMDTKTDGLDLEIVAATLKQGKEARLKILENIEATIREPRKELSPYAPKIIIIHIDPDKIREVVGPGGKMINKIIEETGAAIDIEQDGSVAISCSSAENLDRAVEWIKDITREAEVGEVYVGPVTRILDFGAFVEIFEGTEGMVHVSEITDKERVNDINKYLKVGQMVKVKVIAIDEKGRVNLSIKKAN